MRERERERQLGRKAAFYLLCIHIVHVKQLSTYHQLHPLDGRGDSEGKQGGPGGGI